ncbi:MFS transporter [Pseudooceanicola sp. CBS1P-1]|uniref:MFS transporter n=1 Tax=Pseudooceanicola albus TaxID=2692189 RepID=A0A6L7G2Z9_9RHOB|nr:MULTISPECIES: MFS transporter [Pseudooceanicola]MBT9382422.1 MFS transporter [Pseudooceanicola endophyticus]MXN16963.1 MFS transporter [Pseudooceanicola albus]
MSSTDAGAAGAPSDTSGFFDQPKAVWATAFACVVGFMSIGLVDPILTSIAAGLKASPAQVSLLFTSYFFVTSVMMLITGFVSSRLGARRTLLMGAVLIVVFSALAGTSDSVAALVGFRAGWGLGNAFFVVTALSVLVAVAKGGTGRAVLIYEAAMGLGLSAGPLIGAALGAQSWRFPFFGTATLMAVGFVAIAIFLPSLPKPAQKTSLSAPIRALGHPGLFTVSLAALFYYFAFFTVLAFAPFVLDLSAYAVGAIFFGWGVMLAVFSVFVAPRVEARFGLLPVTTVCLVILAALLLVMGFGNKTAIALCIIASGAVIGVCNTLFTELALEVSNVARPVASAGYNFLRWFAGVIAPFAVPTIAEHTNVLTAFSVATIAALLAPVILITRRHSLIHDAPATVPGPQPVYVALDGTGRDAELLERAIALAHAAGDAPVVALHVRLREALDGQEVALETRERAEEIAAAAHARIEADGLSAREEILEEPVGQAAQSLVTRAREGHALQLVIGTPEGGLEDAIHGSFARAAGLAARRGAPVKLTLVK